ncbi:MAG: hypothetical protein ACTS2F_30750 [Thainema sp.]
MDENRFFVTVIASDKAQLRRLGDYGLDLFQQTSALTARTQVRMRSVPNGSGTATYERTDQMAEAQEFSIEGLLSLAEIGRLVEAGYSVLVRENAAQQSPVQTGGIEFQDWLQAMEGE